MTQTERAIDKFHASLNGLRLYDFEGRGKLLHQFSRDTNVEGIKRGAPPYQIPPEYSWHETAISLIERAFRERWKYSTLSTFIKNHIKTHGSDPPQVLPIPYPTYYTHTFMFAAITIEFTRYAICHKYPLLKALEVRKMASNSFHDGIDHDNYPCFATRYYSPTFPSGTNCLEHHLDEAVHSASTALNILDDYIKLLKGELCFYDSNKKGGLVTPSTSKSSTSATTRPVPSTPYSGGTFGNCPWGKSTHPDLSMLKCYGMSISISYRDDITCVYY